VHQLELLIEPPPALLELALACLEVVLAAAHGHPEDEPPRRQLIDARGLLRQQHRRPGRSEQDVGEQAHALRHRGGRGERHE
jgi:hypothetical protein